MIVFGAALGLLVLAAVAAACSQSPGSGGGGGGGGGGQQVTTPSGLKYTDVTVGNGAEAKRPDRGGPLHRVADRRQEVRQLATTATSRSRSRSAPAR